jgi:arylsulfatase
MKSCQLGGKSYHVHLDGFNLIPLFRGEVKESPRKEFLYWSDDGDLFAIRILDWKISFIEQYHEGLDIWTRGYERLRIPLVYNLRSDPFERGPSSFLYDDWVGHRGFVIVPAQAIVAKWLETLKEYPIRQKPASFNLEDVMRKLTPQD